MTGWMEATACAAGLGGAAYLWGRRQAGRRRHYRELAGHRSVFIRGKDPDIAAPLPTGTMRQAFANEPIVAVRDFLTTASLDRIRAEALAVAAKRTRSFIPTHKKGGTVGYELMHRYCPGCLAFYHAAPVPNWVSALVGQTVVPAGDHDQSANSLLFYDEPGDHINWHYDHNFYNGRQFTALLNLVNRGPANELSASKLVYKSAAGREVAIDTGPNCFVVFEGATVLHRATPTAPGDLRIMLSMTFNTDARITAFGEVMRRVKDTAFFGLRVLWA